ncbi:hypothetical protein B0H14DRAFT_3782774 [Mycena olivaceomarginata]|nr:hypothetical protein B0H14DRAFT_3782774 [Mycena olivaceomarginata]
MTFTYALYGPKGEFIINLIIIRALSEDDDELSYALYRTIHSLIIKNEELFDPYDAESELLELKDFISFILTPFVAVLLIAEDRDLDFIDADDVRTDSNPFGDIMQPEDVNDDLLDDLHRKNIKAMNGSNNVFFSQPPPRQRKRTVEEMEDDNPSDKNKPKTEPVRPKVKANAGTLSVEDFVEPKPKSKKSKASKKEVEKKEKAASKLVGGLTRPQRLKGTAGERRRIDGNGYTSTKGSRTTRHAAVQGAHLFLLARLVLPSCNPFPRSGSCCQPSRTIAPSLALGRHPRSSPLATILSVSFPTCVISRSETYLIGNAHSVRLPSPNAHAWAPSLLRYARLCSHPLLFAPPDDDKWWFSASFLFPSVRRAHVLSCSSPSSRILNIQSLSYPRNGAVSRERGDAVARPAVSDLLRHGFLEMLDTLEVNCAHGHGQMTMPNSTRPFVLNWAPGVVGVAPGSASALSDTSGSNSTSSTGRTTSTTAPTGGSNADGGVNAKGANANGTSGGVISQTSPLSPVGAGFGVVINPFPSASANMGGVNGMGFVGGGMDVEGAGGGMSAAPPLGVGGGGPPPYPKEYSIFVGDLAPETSNSDLVATFPPFHLLILPHIYLRMTYVLTHAHLSSLPPFPSACSFGASAPATWLSSLPPSLATHASPSSCSCSRFPSSFLLPLLILTFTPSFLLPLPYFSIYVLTHAHLPISLDLIFPTASFPYSPPPSYSPLPLLPPSLPPHVLPSSSFRLRSIPFPPLSSHTPRMQTIYALRHAHLPFPAHPLPRRFPHSPSTSPPSSPFTSSLLLLLPFSSSFPSLPPSSLPSFPYPSSTSSSCHSPPSLPPSLTLTYTDTQTQVFRDPVLGLRNDRTPKFICPFASCKSAKIMLDPVTGVSRGYGFVRFTDEADQQRALIQMHGLYCLSRPMRICPATAKFKAPHPDGLPASASTPSHTSVSTPPLPAFPASVSVSAPPGERQTQQQQQQAPSVSAPIAAPTMHSYVGAWYMPAGVSTSQSI